MIDAHQWNSEYGGARQMRPPARPKTPALDGVGRPSKAQLEKHASKFGWEMIEETAAECGIALERPAAVRRAERAERAARRGPTLKQRVKGYLARGLSVDAIAEAENLSPSRARRVVDAASDA